MDILDKAKELGNMIAASEQMTELKKAEAAVESDSKAQNLFSEYKEMQMDVMRATKEKKDKETVEALKEKLLSKQQEVNDYAITRNYMTAKNSFDSFMKTINNVIIYAISGEEPCSPSKCGSCGGGCK